MSNGYITNAMNYKTNISKILIGTREGQRYYSLHNIEHLRQHLKGTALLDCTSDILCVKTPNMDEVKAIQMPKILNLMFHSWHLIPVQWGAV